MIALEAIYKRFADVEVLRGVSVSVPERSVTALIGPSGSGKSTLLRCVNLLELPNSGRVTIGTTSLGFGPGARHPKAEVLALRRLTGMVFQNFQLFPHLTVEENVMEGLVTVLRWPRDEARAHARALLDKVGMASKATAWPANLSGGQQQRVPRSPARWRRRRSVLLYATSRPRRSIRNSSERGGRRARRSWRSEGTTMVMATHDLRLASRVAHEVVFLEAGKVVEKGEPAKIFGSPRARAHQTFHRHADAAARPRQGQRRLDLAAAPGSDQNEIATAGRTSTTASPAPKPSSVSLWWAMMSTWVRWAESAVVWQSATSVTS
jgi:cystine transport system ATP-binding protein